MTFADPGSTNSIGSGKVFTPLATGGALGRMWRILGEVDESEFVIVYINLWLGVTGSVEVRVRM